ncbi:hypothetical protein OSB04_006882 [Centaurea solstitialis]|uniref:Uncharacterized protein n=1 Tax=Centaurea solstitialis TaxID=347529 RepID=A0AA38WI32_9ASTR|nr:hypothetical protein OSB04_006882 [Centaurea solstitialis]
MQQHQFASGQQVIIPSPINNDTFTDLKKVTNSHMPAANAPIKKDKTISLEHARSEVDHSIPKIKILERKRGANNQDGHIEVNEMPEKSPEETLDMMVPEEPQVPEMKRSQ